MTTAGPWIEVSSGPTKKSRQPRSRRPAGVATVTEPSVRARTEVISPEGSACAMEPTVVPRLRIAGWATFAVARASSGWTRAAAPSCEQGVVPDERSHRHAVPGGLDGVEAGHPVDVHQRGRCCEPHARAAGAATGHRRAPWRPHPRREDREGLVEGAGVGVAEGSGFHRLSVPSPMVVVAGSTWSALRSLALVDGDAVQTGEDLCVAVDVAEGRRRAPGADPRGASADLHLRRGEGPGEVPAGDGDDRAQRDAAEREVVGEGQGDVADADDDARGQREPG